MSSRCATQRPESARGATLVVALLLLGIMALLGVSALRSAAIDLAMSGNEQFRSRALQAAEAGVELASVALRAAPPGAAPAPLAAQAMPGTPGDSFDHAVRFVGDDPATVAASGGARTGQHYTIAASGRSLRGASVSIETGVVVIRDAGGVTLGIERRYWKRRDVE
jgi:type IV pilus assembly protein PilX